MAAILNSSMLDSDNVILDSDTLLSSLRFTKKHSHSTLTLTKTNLNLINLIMADILNSAISNSDILIMAILNSAILVFPFKLTHSCQDWFPPFPEKKLHSHFPLHYLNKKKLHSIILTQLVDGSHLKFCHVGFRHCHIGFRHLVIFCQIHSKTLSLHSDSDSN